jgi:hypothetical protein
MTGGSLHGGEHTSRLDRSTQSVPRSKKAGDATQSLQSPLVVGIAPLDDRR